MKATSADSSRLIHTILAHSSIALFYISIFQSFVAIGHDSFPYVNLWATDSFATWLGSFSVDDTADSLEIGLWC
jgi:hypothetical protein